MKNFILFILINLTFIPQLAQADGIATLNEKKTCHDGLRNIYDPPYSDKLTVRFWKKAADNKLLFFAYGSCGLPITVEVPTTWLEDDTKTPRYRELDLKMIRKEKLSGQGIVAGKKTSVPAYLNWTTLNPQEATIVYGLLPRNGESLLQRNDVDALTFTPPAEQNTASNHWWNALPPVSDRVRVQLQNPRSGDCEGIRYEGVGTHGHKTSICLPKNYQDFLYPELDGERFFDSNVTLQFWNLANNYSDGINATGSANDVVSNYQGMVRFYPDADGNGGELWTYVHELDRFPSEKTGRNSFRKNIDLIKIQAPLKDLPGVQTRESTMLFFQTQVHRDKDGFIAYEMKNGTQRVLLQKLGAKIYLPTQFIPTPSRNAELKEVPVRIRRYDFTKSLINEINSHSDMTLSYVSLGEEGKPGIKIQYKITGAIPQFIAHEITFDIEPNHLIEKQPSSAQSFNQTLTPVPNREITTAEPSIDNLEPIRADFPSIDLHENDPTAEADHEQPTHQEIHPENPPMDKISETNPLPTTSLHGSGCSLQIGPKQPQTAKQLSIFILGLSIIPLALLRASFPYRRQGPAASYK